ncbi:dnaJ homolog subfamily C member 2-like isoform X2 [Acanthaster planci]|uniref:DnaJ homolog subfamily C member 2 n=1 Tax=Acanthaster planci TaxID=133434 RepID=A0A8B7ZJ74_ACAPL|nr:dnaJ homolog subfamily C member 2-like isoform X2 [Acanthaster planci]
MTGVTSMPPCAPNGVKTKVFGTLSGAVTVRVEPVGRWFEAHLHRRHHHHNLSHTSGSLRSDSSSDSSDDDLEYDEDDSMLLTLDPKEWKNQDHYAVLGLSKVRHEATADDIKRAYKRMVLKHHPDKRKPKDGVTKPRQSGDDDYFTCITRAYEILGNRTKRRSYDSVDPNFDDSVPPLNNNSRENFFKEFSKVFERNARWSKKKRVPQLGDANSTLEEVNKFYHFWYDFDSWREFSYLDEEEKEKGENREERRWIERQNKTSRQSRKKEETTRMRQLVDNAYACDPRIKRFKEEEKEKKAAEKKAKQEAAKAAQMEKERERREALEAERLAKEKEEEEAKAKAQAAKKERDAAKKVLKKERKMLRDICKKDNYFTDSEADRVKHMADVEMLCDRLSAVNLQTLNESLSKADQTAAAEIFSKQVSDMHAEMERERQEDLRKLQEAQSGKGGGGGSGGAGKNWSEEEIQLLVKAVKLFPAGTVSRYEVIANFINQHSTSEHKKTAKDVINKTKNLQKLDSAQKEEVNKRAFDKFEQTKSKAKKQDLSAPSERLDTDAVEEKKSPETAEGPKPWSTDEQKRLEQALKTYPANTKERWDRIAEAVPGRSKKECMLRYKELVEMVKAKKAAQAAVAKK